MSFQFAKTLLISKTLRIAGFMLVVAGLGLIGQATAEGQRHQTFENHSDFGPSPEEFLSLPKTPEINASHIQLVPANAGDRPAYPADQGNRPARVRKPSIEPQTPPATSLPAEAAKQDRAITQRYQDPRVLRIITELTSTTGEAFFREVSQMVDSRHIEPSSYGQRCNRAWDQLKLALSNSAFQTATGIVPSEGQIRSVRNQLESLRYEQPVRNLSEAITALRQTERLLQQSIGLNPGVVCFEFVYGSLGSLDKYSMLMPPEKTGDVNVGLEENLVGIGVEVAGDTSGLKIVKTIRGGPAAEATLRRGDIITAVDGHKLQGMTVGQAVDLIAGPEGSSVKLSLMREERVGQVTLVRREITVHSVSEVRMLEETSHVGYIKLEQFAESSAKELDEALWKLHREGMESLVFDLRGNPGGYLTTAIEISDRFLPSGTIVSTRGRTSDDNSQETAQYAETWKIPLVVLVDHDSASASEIFAAAIQENDRGLIVGETSYGKGTVQTLFPLRSVTAGLRLTTAKFYSPDGREMAGHGVTPDVHVAAGQTDDDSAMLQAGIEAARDPRVQTMARRFARSNRTGLQVLEVTRR